MLDTLTPPPTETSDDVGLIIAPETLRRLGKGSKAAARRWIRTWIDNEIDARPITGPTDKPANVRMATKADEDGLLELMMTNVTENAPEFIIPSPDRILKQIRAATDRKSAFLGIIDGPDGKPVACINICFAQWWWSEMWYLQETWNYVHPAHRATKHAENLMKFARWCSDDMTRGFGYRVWLIQGVTAKDNLRSKVAFYSRHLNYMGAIFMYPHPGGNGQ